MKYPEWVQKHKIKNREIIERNGNYYLYEICSKYDKEKKRAQKITKAYLGKITEDGVIRTYEKKTTAANINHKIDKSLVVKEFGNIALLEEDILNIQNNLNKYFDKDLVKIILCIAVIKLVEQSPLKRVEHYYDFSFLSEMFPELNLSKTNITSYLKLIGNNRGKIVEFMKSNITKDTTLLFDGCNIISNSENMNINQVGYNSKGSFDPQINLLYAFDKDNKTPQYYRILSGNTKDVTAFSNCVKESEIQDMVVIADKGFGSKDNFAMLDKEDLRYIIPLRRNNEMIDYEKLRTVKRSDFDGHFIYNKNAIWYIQQKTNDGKIVYTYLNDILKTEEIKDYLFRIENKTEGYSEENFFNKEFKFGTLTLATNLYNKTPKEIYEMYKTRNEIEQCFDMLKNILGADRIYMQNEIALEGWSFINHIALILLYQVYNKMLTADVLSKYSIKDLFEYLKNVKKIKLNGEWQLAEVSKKHLKLFEKLDVKFK